MNRKNFIKASGILSLGALVPITLAGEPRKNYSLNTIVLSPGEYAMLDRENRIGYVIPRRSSVPDKITCGEKILAPTFEIATNPQYKMTQEEYCKHWKDLYNHENIDKKLKAHQYFLEKKNMLRKSNEDMDREEENAFETLADLGCKDIYKFVRQERYWLPCSEIRTISVIYFEEIGIIGLV